MKRIHLNFSIFPITITAEHSSGGTSGKDNKQRFLSFVQLYLTVRNALFEFCL